MKDIQPLMIHCQTPDADLADGLYLPRWIKPSRFDFKHARAMRAPARLLKALAPPAGIFTGDRLDWDAFLRTMPSWLVIRENPFGGNSGHELEFRRTSKPRVMTMHLLRWSFVPEAEGIATYEPGKGVALSLWMYQGSSRARRKLFDGRLATDGSFALNVTL
jgi:hypothetical protein